jgi:hypothetical protein
MAHLARLLVLASFGTLVADAGVWTWHKCSRQALFSGKYGRIAVESLERHRSSMLQKVWPALQLNGSLADGKLYESLEPYLPCPGPHAKVKRFGGDGDGGKLLCPVPHLMQSQSCVVVSMGSNGNYEFEASILNMTNCHIHTYDCTYSGKSIDPRHTYHDVCIGRGDARFKTWNEASADWGGRRVTVAKIDIEGHESTLLRELQADMLLPSQIVVEMHILYGNGEIPHWAAAVTPKSQAEGALLFMHMANLGYSIVAKELNPYGACCAEYTFLLVEGEGSLD